MKSGRPTSTSSLGSGTVVGLVACAVVEVAEVVVDVVEDLTGWAGRFADGSQAVRSSTITATPIRRTIEDAGDAVMNGCGGRPAGW
jgi:hypothetical protein